MRVLVHKQLKDKGIPWCREHVARKVKAREFPQPISLSAHRIAWLETEIDAWLEARAADRGQQAA